MGRSERGSSRVQGLERDGPQSLWLGGPHGVSDKCGASMSSLRFGETRQGGLLTEALWPKFEKILWDFFFAFICNVGKLHGFYHKHRFFFFIFSIKSCELLNAFCCILIVFLSFAEMVKVRIFMGDTSVVLSVKA